ncbi:MAG: LacI family transcriptional regulator [Salinicola sp.]|mgnify:CR=1 FL=1|uniref:LacI family DNA-binding transcriptional regulator n=1 Tax=Salinicola sp. TaxID=1978524 RepID=UPI000C9403DE|nr:LacI family DNA-binding transcriptional regulator [Salinicola sp.]MAM55861.1 LacI family transcriptional regulator [Salinicola sp.]NRB56660.1 LacI family DNA-binding transcriptional regulator [Salinicola sp.]
MGSTARTRVTLKDIAAHAGVSRSTVSLVMQESELVAGATRKRVQEAAAALGYVYNRGAATLRSSRTATVGVVVHDIANPFFGALMAGIDETLQAADYIPFLASSGDSLDRQARFLARMREHRVDALLLCPAEETPAASIEAIADWGMPCIEVMRHVGKSPLGDYVGADLRTGVINAVRHLVIQGHRRITLLAGIADHSADRERLAGYRHAMHEAGLDDLSHVDRGPLTRCAGRERTLALLRGNTAPTALICHNDLVALGALLALSHLGLRAGRDCAVIGVDDIEEAALAEPALSSIATHPRAIGRNAAELALKRIAQPEGERQRIVLEAPLVIRASSRISSAVAQEST